MNAQLHKGQIAGWLESIRNHPLVGDARGKGILVSIELVKNKETKAPASSDYAKQVIALMKQEGIVMGSNSETVAGFDNILQLSPPLSITNDEVEMENASMAEENYKDSVYVVFMRTAKTVLSFIQGRRQLRQDGCNYKYHPSISKLKYLKSLL